MFLILAEIKAAFTRIHTTLFSEFKSKVNRRPTSKKDLESCFPLLRLAGMQVELHPLSSPCMYIYDLILQFDTGFFLLPQFTWLFGILQAHSIFNYFWGLPSRCFITNEVLETASGKNKHGKKGTNIYYFPCLKEWATSVCIIFYENPVTTLRSWYYYLHSWMKKQAKRG